MLPTTFKRPIELYRDDFQNKKLRTATLTNNNTSYYNNTSYDAPTINTSLSSSSSSSSSSSATIIANNTTIVGGLIKIKLADIIKTLYNPLNDETSRELKLTLQDDEVPVELVVPTSIKKYFFGVDVFLSTFLGAFKSKFPINSDLQSLHFPKLKIRILHHGSGTINEPTEYNSIEYVFFRQYTCLMITELFSIHLPMCACYPVNSSELLAHQSGLPKNCYNVACQNLLQVNPLLYDGNYIGACSEASISQIAINYMRFIGYKNTTINVNIKQIIDQIRRQSSTIKT